MSKSKDKIRVRFVGHNAEHVAGSQILIEAGYSKKKILLECGLIQDNYSTLKSYQVNVKKFPFKPKEIDYIFVCHAHIDHIGRIPKLYKENCTAKIIAPEGLKDLYREMCLDSAKIMERDAAEISKKTGKSYEPIYNAEDVYKSLQYWEEYPSNMKIKISDSIEFNFLGSGHIFKAYQLELWIKNRNNTKKIAFTSDLGNISLPQYYVEKFEEIKRANLFIGETTYCSQQRSVTIKQREKDLEKLEAIIRQTCIDGKGKVLIPVFALARCQSILTYLFDIFSNDENFNIPIYVDSPLANKVTDIYLSELKNDDLEKLEKVLNWKNVKRLKEFSDTENAVNSEQSCVFLSCSGMMTAGRSVYLASKLLPHGYNYIVFCGYSTEGSLAWKIKQKRSKSVAIDGKTVICRSNVANLTSFSSHMQHNDLLNYYSEGNFDKIALVHGEFKDKCEFARELQEKIRKKNKTGRVISVNSSTEILL